MNFHSINNYLEALWITVIIKIKYTITKIIAHL